MHDAERIRILGAGQKLIAESFSKEHLICWIFFYILPLTYKESNHNIFYMQFSRDLSSIQIA